MCDFPHHVRMLFSLPPPPPPFTPLSESFSFSPPLFFFSFFLLPLSLCDSRRLLHPYREALSSVDFWEASGTGLWPVARNRLREEAHNGKALGLSCATRNSFIFFSRFLSFFYLFFFILCSPLSTPPVARDRHRNFSFPFRSVFCCEFDRDGLPFFFFFCIPSRFSFDTVEYRLIFWGVD